MQQELPGITDKGGRTIPTRYTIAARKGLKAAREQLAISKSRLTITNPWSEEDCK